MTYTTTCPCCGAAHQPQTLSEAITLALPVERRGSGYAEMLLHLAAHGPLSLSGINARPWGRVRVGTKLLRPVNLRQLQARANKVTSAHADFAMLVSQKAVVGGTDADPVAFLFIAPTSDMRQLAGAEPHVKLSDALMS